MNGFARPAPLVAESMRPYWEAAANGALVLPWCEVCRRFESYARPFCSRCLGAPLSWRPASGTGTVYSFTVVRQAREPFFAVLVPYVVAIVELDEGVRLLTNISTSEPDRVQIGSPVSVQFETVKGGGAVPVFVLGHES